MNSHKLQQLKQKLLYQQSLKGNFSPEVKSPKILSPSGSHHEKKETNSIDKEAIQLKEELSNSEPEERQEEDQSEDKDQVESLPPRIEKQNQVEVERQQVNAPKQNVEGRGEVINSIENGAKDVEPSKKLETDRTKESLLGQKINEEPNLDLLDKHNISCSVNQELKHPILAPVHEHHQGDDSKQEKKKRKIVLKELQKINKCISFLKSSVKGLELVQQEMSNYPQLREGLLVYLKELKDYQHSDIF